METVFIAPGSAIPSADLQALLARHWPVEQARGGALVIQEGGRRLYAYHDPPEGPERLGRLGLDYSSLATPACERSLPQHRAGSARRSGSSPKKSQVSAPLPTRAEVAEMDGVFTSAAAGGLFSGWLLRDGIDFDQMVKSKNADVENGTPSLRMSSDNPRAAARARRCLPAEGSNSRS